MTALTYRVGGMAGNSCIGPVASALTELGGVTRVRIDLSPDGTALVTLTSQARLPDAVIATALDHAGDYQLIAPPARWH
jgi:copper chaperone CopZ